MSQGILIFGANGSGKTTLARELAQMLRFNHMDIEDYAFQDATIPYSSPRPRSECITLMLDCIAAHDSFVLSSVTGAFGAEITAMYVLAVHLTAPAELRVQRVQKRAQELFGERMQPGGDLAEQERKFIDFVASRSLEPIEQWAKTLVCPVVCMESTASIKEMAAEIAKRYSEMNAGHPTRQGSGEGLKNAGEGGIV
ncbi:MAG: AAA family ATPase [Oscillospiraceae bacterium]|jgi:shikimate kinase|nr:AAA family ATPase [Oscillospiraceae bacterium]